MTPAVCAPRRRPAAPATAGSAVAHRGEPTLDALVSAAWQALSGPSGTADCPVCGGALQARFGAGARPVGGACGACGAQLS